MDELKFIKKHYGEAMMHFCRDNFATILEENGKLYKVLSSKFAPDKSLYDDIIMQGMEESFKVYIYDIVGEKYENHETYLTPGELLAKAGYDFYECKTEEDIQKFKKYYAKGEKLCTFRGGRLNRCFVFFAVKKNVDEIKREDFKHPKREDEYGTSVISIQFYRGGVNNVSIKNRYNHTVRNPDATFGNNLDNIIEGLTDSFVKKYHLNNKNSNIPCFGLSNYCLASDGKYYKYNFEDNDIYYAPNNIIIKHNSIVTEYLDKARYIVMDKYILDLKEKTLFCFNHDDSFPYHFYEKRIRKIEINKIGNNRVIKIDDKVIVINKFNQIIKYEDLALTNIDNDFMSCCVALEEINIPNVENIGNKFLSRNKNIKSLNLPHVTYIGNDFLLCNKILEKFTADNLLYVGENFLFNNEALKEISLPEIYRVGEKFIFQNTQINSINLPKVEIIDDCFLSNNTDLVTCRLPIVKKIYNEFLCSNNHLKKVDMPLVYYIGNDFLLSNFDLIEMNLPRLSYAGSNFCSANEKITNIDLPSLIKTGIDFFRYNAACNKINVPLLKKLSTGFMQYNECLQTLDLPVVEEIEDMVLTKCQKLESINIPSVVKIDNGFLVLNYALKYLYAPNVQTIGNEVLTCNTSLEELNLPNLISLGYSFMTINSCLKKIIMPKLSSMGVETFVNISNVQELVIPDQFKESLNGKNLIKSK